MASIKNIEGLSVAEINKELNNGAKFIVYQYTVSVLVMTFKNSSDIYFVKSNQNKTVVGLKYTLLTFFLGWWGIPWGPIYSIGSLYGNLTGGKDVTFEVVQSISQQA